MLILTVYRAARDVLSEAARLRQELMKRYPDVSLES